MKKQSNWMFMVEVLIFINTGYALGVGNYFVVYVSLIAGMFVAYITGKQMIEEAREEEQWQTGKQSQ